MVAAGRFFVVNRLGRWLNRHGHRFIHPGKSGVWALRTAQNDLSCFICRAAWAFIETRMDTKSWPK